MAALVINHPISINATTPNGSSKKNATTNTRKHSDVSTTPIPSPSRQQLTKKSCHRHVSTQSKYFKKKKASSNNTPPPVALKDDTDKSIVVHDSSHLSSVSYINQPHHTSSKICTYDVGGVQTTIKSSLASTQDRKPFGDIGNSPTKLLSNSATRSTTKSLLSQQSPSFVALQPFGTITKTIKPPPLLEQEDANLATISNVNATDADTLPATLPVAAPTRIRKPRPRNEIEATLKKNGRDLDSEKSMRRLKSAIMISERNTDAPLPDDMNCILYQSKPSNINKERVIRARRFDKYLEYSIGDEVFYRGSITAADAANAFTALDFTVSYSTIRRRAGLMGSEPSLLGDRIAVKEVIECIYDNKLGFVGTNENEVEASKDMIRHNLPHLLANLRKDKEPSLLNQAGILAMGVRWSTSHVLAVTEAEIKEKRDKEEKQRLIHESIVPLGGRSVEDTVNACLLAEKKELAELKEKASRFYQKYVELGSDIKRLSGKELEALVKYICIEEEDKFSRHRANKTSMMKRLGECVPSWIVTLLNQVANISYNSIKAELILCLSIYAS